MRSGRAACARSSMPAPTSTTTRSSRRSSRRPGSTSCSSPTGGRGWCAAGSGGRCPRRSGACRQTLANRYAKFFPYAVLPEADCSIYLDANTLVLGDLTPLVAEFLASGADIGLFPHRERSTIAEEFEFAPAGGQDPARGRGEGRGAAPPLPRGRAAARPALHRECDHLPPPRQPGARGGDGSLVGGAGGLHPARPAEPALRALQAPSSRSSSGTGTTNTENPYFMRYLHRAGRAQRPERVSEEQAALRPASTGRSAARRCSDCARRPRATGSHHRR